MRQRLVEIARTVAGGLLIAMTGACGARSSLLDGMLGSVASDAGTRDDGAARAVPDGLAPDAPTPKDARSATESGSSDAARVVEGGSSDGSADAPFDAPEADARVPPDGAVCVGCWKGSNCIPLASTTVHECGFGGPCVACPGPDAKCFKGACSFSDPGCTASNCSGCCLDANTCSNGLSADACGSGGLECQGCGPEETGFFIPCAPQDGGGGKCQPACNSGACPGCCDGAECRLGQSGTSCGTLGATCTACPSGEFCKENGPGSGGVCQAPCAPGNCAGCCENDVCAVGTQDIACGSGGESCVDCTASHDQCGSGTCGP